LMNNSGSEYGSYQITILGIIQLPFFPIDGNVLEYIL
jgi:hypothetical protein